MFHLQEKYKALIIRISLVPAIIILLASCVSKKEIIYLQDIESIASKTEKLYSTTVIQPNDILNINVSAFDMEAVAPFNLMMPTRPLQNQQTDNSTSLQKLNYLVNNDGTIEFPVLGTVMVGGLTRQEVTLKLKNEISAYVKDPIVNVTIANFKVTVLGEVSRPGTFTIPDERVTLLEAIGRAGDLTIFGKRENIIVLREKDGIKTHTIVDITKSDFLHSEYYFLQQNDVVYVQPNSAQISSAAYNRNTSVYISIASVLISLLLVISR